MEQNKTVLAKRVYDTLCHALDKQGWRYEHKGKGDDLVIRYGAQGDDLPMEFFCFVTADRQYVNIISVLPFACKEEKRMDMVVALSMVNQDLVNGHFNLDIGNGELQFDMCQYFDENTLPSEELLLRMVMTAAATVDAYNDKLLMLSTNILTLEQFAEQIKDKQD